MNKNTIYTIILLCFCLASCRQTKQILKKNITEQKPEYLFEQLKKNELKFEYFSANFNAEAKINGNFNTFSGSIRIKKDSIIWANILKLGIEIIRFSITPDSFKFINRINKSYFLSDFKQLNNTIKVDIDFDIIQSLILGNDLSLYENNNIFKASIEGNQYKLSTLGRRKLKKHIKNEYETHKILIQNIWLNPDNFKITANYLKEIKNDNRKLITTYSQFKAVNNQLFPYKTSIDIYSEDYLINIIINYTKVKLNELTNFPFTIPANYTITDKNNYYEEDDK